MPQRRRRVAVAVAVALSGTLVVTAAAPASADTIDATTTTVSINSGQAGLTGATETRLGLPGGWRKEITIPAPPNGGTYPTVGTLDYTWRTPARTFWRADDLGGIWLISADTGKAVAHVNAPWARDRYGTKLGASMKIIGADGDGIRITYTRPSTRDRYPITIDPHYTWGWITGTVYFNRSETIQVAIGTASLQGIAQFLPLPWSAIIIANLIYYTAVASLAQSNGTCLYIKSTGEAGQYSGSQGDGYCQ